MNDEHRKIVYALEKVTKRFSLAIPAIRYKVVMVEHRWDKLMAPVVVVMITHL